MEPFLRITRGNQHLLAAVDNLAKLVRLLPMKNTTSRGVMKSLEKLILEKGLPRKIISDRRT